VLERRQDPRRQHRRATALDELDERMEVHAALACKPLREARLEAGPAKARAAPGDNVRGLAPAAGVVSDSKLHTSLAAGRDRFLLP
jgi:hypothetical protein